MNIVVILVEEKMSLICECISLSKEPMLLIKQTFGCWMQLPEKEFESV